MSTREKRLLIFFAAAGFVALNFFGFNFLLGKRAQYQARLQESERKLESARMIRDSTSQIAEEMEWLGAHEPEPAAQQDVQTRLQQLCEREARSSGLTIDKQTPLPADASEGRHYHRARIQLTVSGSEEALYRWLDQLNSPDQFRIATQLRLSPDKKDDTKIDCTATIEQWFVPTPPSV
ncbi:MAG: hypothetical protein V4733_10640 [Verrucomicrobiota bacterium]